MQVRNQSYLRRRNKEEIIKLLREQSRSYSDIARILKLSNTAIAKIADDLLADEIIRRDGDSKGRAGINLSINPDFGYVIAIDFSHWQTSYCAADFTGEILMRRHIDLIDFRIEDLVRLIDAIGEMVKDPALKDRRLRCIAIATPGKIDKESGKFILNPRFKDMGDVSFQNMFAERFGCSVTVQNDINLALAGEKTYGSALKGVENALMLHIDVGTGAALLVDGKVYEGSHGYAGEIGYFKLNTLLSDEDNLGNLNYANYYDSVSLFSALSILKREIAMGTESVVKEWLAERNLDWKDITIDMMVTAYQQNDALCRRILNSAARVIGTFAGCMADFLDVETILINGSVIGLGEDYLQQIKINAGNYCVAYPNLAENATIMGTINAAIEEVLKEKL